MAQAIDMIQMESTKYLQDDPEFLLAIALAVLEKRLYFYYENIPTVAERWNLPEATVQEVLVEVCKSSALEQQFKNPAFVKQLTQECKAKGISHDSLNNLTLYNPSPERKALAPTFTSASEVAPTNDSSRGTKQSEMIRPAVPNSSAESANDSSRGTKQLAPEQNVSSLGTKELESIHPAVQNSSLDAGSPSTPPVQVDEETDELLVDKLLDGINITLTVSGLKSKGATNKKLGINVRTALFDADTQDEFQSFRAQARRLVREHSPPLGKEYRWLEFAGKPWIAKKDYPDLEDALEELQQEFHEWVDQIFAERAKKWARMHDRRQFMSIYDSKTQKTRLELEQYPVPTRLQSLKALFKLAWEPTPAIQANEHIAIMIDSAKKRLTKTEARIEEVEARLKEKQTESAEEAEQLEAELAKLRDKRDHLAEHVDKSFEEHKQQLEGQYLAELDEQLSDRVQDFFAQLEQVAEVVKGGGKLHKSKLNSLRKSATEFLEMNILNDKGCRAIADNLRTVVDTLEAKVEQQREAKGELPELEFDITSLNLIDEDLPSSRRTSLGLQGNFTDNLKAIWDEAEPKPPTPEKSAKKKGSGSK